MDSTRYLYLPIILFLVILSAFWIPRAYQARKNVVNSTRITLGMESKEVVHIMGEPDSRRLSYFDESDSLYYYQPPFGASSGIEIIFGEDGKVKRILPYE